MSSDVYKNFFKIGFIFKKQQAFFECLRKLLISLGWDKWETIEGREEDKISKWKDIVDYYQNKSYSIDIFYGRNKIIFVVRGNKKSRQKLINEISKISKWIKSKRKLPKIKTR